MKFRSLLLVLVAILSCQPMENIQIIALDQTQLIPEGIAVHESENIIYLNNLHSKNLIQFNENGENLISFESPYSGLLMGVGVEQKNGKIYAIGTNQFDTVNISAIQIFDSKSSRLEKSYEMQDTSMSFLNDLAVTNSGKIYATNSSQKTIYTVDNRQEIVPLFDHEQIQYPNGIALSDDESKLYVASHSYGIQVIDLENFELLSVKDTTLFSRGLDGIKFYKNSIIGVRNASRNKANHAVVRYYLDTNGVKVIDADTLLHAHPLFNVPTTLDVKGDYLYVLANSQLEKLGPSGELINPDSLTATYILKMKLD